MPHEFRELTERVALVLQEQWDPIGNGALPACEDEYADYAATVAGRLVKGASVSELAELLLRIERKAMGLSGDPARARSVAEQLCALRD